MIIYYFIFIYLFLLQNKENYVFGDNLTINIKIVNWINIPNLKHLRKVYSPRFEINLYKIGKEEKEIGKLETKDYDIASFDFEENIEEMGGKIKEEGNEIIKLTKNNKFKIKVFKLNKEGNTEKKNKGGNTNTEKVIIVENYFKYTQNYSNARSLKFF